MYFITFEGADGSGKTTQIKLLARELEQRKILHILTREPGGCEISEHIREVLVSPRGGKLSINSEILLVNAARSEHLQQVINPALQAGKIVLCDRYIDSTLVYQGYCNEGNTALIEYLHENVCDNRWPDLTFFFDIEVSLAQARREKRGESYLHYHLENIERQKAVAEGYKRLYSSRPGTIVINASLPIEIQQQQIIGHILNLINQ